MAHGTTTTTTTTITTTTTTVTTAHGTTTPTTTTAHGATALRHASPSSFPLSELKPYVKHNTKWLSEFGPHVKQNTKLLFYYYYGPRYYYDYDYYCYYYCKGRLPCGCKQIPSKGPTFGPRRTRGFPQIGPNLGPERQGDSCHRGPGKTRALLLPLRLPPYRYYYSNYDYHPTATTTPTTTTALPLLLLQLRLPLPLLQADCRTRAHLWTQKDKGIPANWPELESRKTRGFQEHTPGKTRAQPDRARDPPQKKTLHLQLLQLTQSTPAPAVRWQSWAGQA